MTHVSPHKWNEYILRVSPSQFLQSCEWGVFQESIGRKVHYLQDDHFAMVAIQLPLQLGFSYLYIPRGPVDCPREVLNRLIEPLLQRDRGIVFIKFEPMSEDMISVGTRKVRGFQPEHTNIIDLKKNEKELLSQMHEKTRYNIRLAEKKGVIITEGSSSDRIDVFIDLLNQTAQRDRFHLHDDSYYRSMISHFESKLDNTKTPNLRLYLAEFEREYIAGALVMYFGDTAVYLHGASGQKHRNVMAPYLLHWSIIRQAREMGFAMYDLGGIAPQGDEAHPWTGITRFKKGFGGDDFNYLGTYDIPVRPILYGLYRLAKKILQ